MHVKKRAYERILYYFFGGVMHMKRKEFTLETADGKTIQAYKWQKEAMDVKGVFQITHGMAEHSLRYEPFITFLTAHGFIVYAHDHRGHGNSYTKPSDRGYFAKRRGFKKVVHDTVLVTDYIQQNQPHLPLFLFGHSMGSLIVRRLVQQYDRNYAGIILSGTAGDPGWIGKVGLIVAKLEKLIRGRKKQSPLMDRLIFGNHNKRFTPERTKHDFLTRDETVVDAYIADDNCGFICTTSFYVDLLEGTLLIHRDEEVAKTPKHLPIFLLAGDDDPVGNYGDGVQAVYEQYLEQGLQQVSMKLYEEGRHEMLSELNKMEVYTDILNWLETILKGEQQ